MQILSSLYSFSNSSVKNCERDHLCVFMHVEDDFRMGLPEICKTVSASKVKAAKSLQSVSWPVRLSLSLWKQYTFKPSVYCYLSFIYCNSCSVILPGVIFHDWIAETVNADVSY